MQRACLTFSLVFFFFCCSAQIPVEKPGAGVYVGELRCMDRVDPLGIDAVQPRLSWRLYGSPVTDYSRNAPETGRNIVQTAYELHFYSEEDRSAGDRTVKTGPGDAGPLLIWQSGKLYSDASIQVAYQGPVLRAGVQYRWQVRVWDNHGHVSAWSKMAIFRMGLLQPSNWTAKWIGPGFVEDTARRPPPVYSRTFTLGGTEDGTGARTAAAGSVKTDAAMTDAEMSDEGRSGKIGKVGKGGGPRKIRAATLYITAHGLYEGELNGSRIGEAYFTPGWTSYDKRLQYQVYNVTKQVKTGLNQVRVTVGDGWWRGVFGGDMKQDHYGKDASLLFQLEVEFTDGTRTTIQSDSSWRSGTGPIRYADLYNGEIYDTRIDEGPAGKMNGGERTNETSVKMNDEMGVKMNNKRGGQIMNDTAVRMKKEMDGKMMSKTGVKMMNEMRVKMMDETGVTVEDLGTQHLVTTMAEPVKRQETFAALRIFTDPKGETLIDFGQNISGWVRAVVAGKAGDTIRIAHAEALDKDGNFYTGNLREAKAEDTYILSGAGSGGGTGQQVLEPHFTFHGFRYAKIEGFRGALRPEDYTAVALYSDCAKTGSFSCSDPRLNQLQHNIVWSQQDNFLDIPSDCPQRSERYGWTGDAQIFARTASWNMDVLNFFSKWLKDLAADQDAWGGLPVIIPDLNGHRNTGHKRAVAGWGDAATIVPWTLYRAYADTVLLREQYPSMKAWVDQIRRSSPDNLWMADGYGDWLAPDTITRTPIPFISQCYFAWSTQLLVQAATVLGNREDSVYYSNLVAQVKAAFLRSYYPLPNTETAYVLALQFDLLPDSLRADAVSKLVACVHAHGNMLSTGFLGTPGLLPVLSRYGQTDLAYKILMQDSPPSWLYPVKMGATTIWEKWDAISPDGTVGEKSLNHYSYGAVGDWLYRVVAGITEEEPGYRTIRIEPHPGGGLTWVNASYECPYGKIVCEWKLERGQFVLHLEVPAGVKTEVYLPGQKDVIRVGSGSYEYRIGKLIQGVHVGDVKL